MKKKVSRIYRYMVGYEYGWGGEGSERWYYFLALVMSVMLTWWFRPKLGILFTIHAVIHYISTCLFGYFNYHAMSSHYDLNYNSPYIVTNSVVLYVMLLPIFFVCLFSDFWWTLLIVAIVVVAELLAPNGIGGNIFFVCLDSRKDIEDIILLFFHTLWFVAFVTITILTPISIWLRLAVIAFCMLMHKHIDTHQERFQELSIVLSDALSTIVGAIYDKIDKYKNKDKDEEDDDEEKDEGESDDEEKDEDEDEKK